MKPITAPPPSPWKLLRWMLLPLLLAACQPSTEPAAARQERPPHRVEVLVVQYEEAALQRERGGTLAAERILNVVAREEGVLLELPYRRGDAVAAGALLYRIDDALLQNALRRARATLEEAQQSVERMRSLRTSRAVSEEQVVTAETALTLASVAVEELTLRLGYTRMTAPFAAIVSERLAEPGEYVTARQSLLTLIDPSALVTEVTLSEQLLARLHVGDPVTLTLDALGSQRHSGTIARIHPAINPTTRQGQVEVRLDPAPSGARPGQLARATFTIRPEPQLLVPFAALRSDLQGEYLYLYRDGKAHRQAVRTGSAMDQRVQVLEGLTEGDRVIVRGLMDLRHAKPVTLHTSSEPAADDHPRIGEQP